MTNYERRLTRLETRMDVDEAALVIITFTSVGNEAGSPCVYPLEEPLERVDAECRPSRYKKENVHFCGVTSIR